MYKVALISVRGPDIDRRQDSIWRMLGSLGLPRMLEMSALARRCGYLFVHPAKQAVWEADYTMEVIKMWRCYDVYPERRTRDVLQIMSA
jgi:hypothetical protein